MTTGVKTYSSAGQATQKFDDRPPEPKFYTATLRSAAVALQTTKDKRAFITGLRFELQGTASVEGGRNRSVTHTVWLDTKAAKSDGFASIRKADGIVPLARAMGEEIDLPEVDVTMVDDEGNESTTTLLDGRAVKQWLQDHDGRTLQVKTGIRADRQDPKIKYGCIKMFVEQQTMVPAGNGSSGIEEVSITPN